MANTIKLRQGTTTPSAGSFSIGEPAWDKSASKLYIKNAAGSMVEIGAGGGVGANQADYGLVAEAVSSTADYGSVV